MKKQMYLFCSVFLFTVMSCGVDSDLSPTHQDSDVEIRKYHWSHVNPAGVDYTVYQAAAFCGDGYSNQIQIWAPSLSICQCLLNQFINECDEEINNLSECTAKSSKYPPLSEDCTG